MRLRETETFIVIDRVDVSMMMKSSRRRGHVLDYSECNKEAISRVMRVEESGN